MHVPYTHNVAAVGAVICKPRPSEAIMLLSSCAIPDTAVWQGLASGRGDAMAKNHDKPITVVIS